MTHAIKVDIPHASIALLNERGELIQGPAAWDDVWICAHEHGYIHSALIDAALSMCQQERLMLDILEKL